MPVKPLLVALAGKLVQMTPPPFETVGIYRASTALTLRERGAGYGRPKGTWETKKRRPPGCSCPGGGWVALHCAACGQDHELSPVLSLAFDSAFGAEAHIAIKDGGEPPIETCPECGEETFVVAEACCAACDFDVPEDATYAVCGVGLSAHDYAECGGFCSYHAWAAAKND